jgi:hypothetical protein
VTNPKRLRNVKDGTRVTVAITVVCLVLAIVHLVSPNLKLDAVTLILLGFAALPWLRPILRFIR